MFALLALAGDVGCSAGPTFVGIITNNFGGKLSTGILAAVAFPLLFLAGVLLYNKTIQKTIVTDGNM